MLDAMTRLKVEKSCLTRALRLISKAVHQEAPGILSAVVETWWLLSPMLLILLQEFFRHSLSLLQLPFRVKSSNHLQASPLRLA